MIDEELYQQAADELNSDKRRDTLWERACRLASNDYDEARFLYTNLRVEELLAEREKNAPPETLQSDDPIGQSVNLESMALDDSMDASSASLHDSLDQSAVPPDSRHFVNFESEEEEEELLDQTVSTPPGAYNTAADPDADLLSDYVSDSAEGLDDTYIGDAFGEDELATELEIFNEEHSQEIDLSVHGIESAQPDAVKDTGSEAFFEQSPSAPQEDSLPDKPEAAEENVSFLDASPVLDDANLTASFDAMVGNDIADEENYGTDQARVLDSEILDSEQSSIINASELTGVPEGSSGQILDDVNYKPDDKSNVEDPLHWLEEDDNPRIAANALNDNSREPFVIENDPLSNELSRQANELDLGDDLDQTAFISEVDNNIYTEEKHPQNIGQSSDERSTSDNSRHDAPVDSGIQSIPSELVYGQIEEIGDEATSSSRSATHNYDFPLDLTPGRKGTPYSIYRRNNSAQAVKKGVSWGALFLTLPYLIYRHLFGTALAYMLLWIVAIGGLILSSLAWIDAGTDVTPVVQACTIGFALLCFIGLVYLPFRYGNTWRGNKLERRGFDLVATTRAKNPGRAISRARRHAALD